jgi:GMP synthase-like glutamine amidotransferase
LAGEDASPGRGESQLAPADVDEGVLLYRGAEHARHELAAEAVPRDWGDYNASLTMKPIAVLQHDPLQRPGYLLDFLDELAIPARIIRPCKGDDVPRSSRFFSGLAFLGSDASVNDPAPWIARELRLVGDAISCDIPALGHCFGGQLMARVLGAAVKKNAFVNIGWSKLRLTPAGRRIFAGQSKRARRSTRSGAAHMPARADGGRARGRPRGMRRLARTHTTSRLMPSVTVDPRLDIQP